MQQNIIYEQPLSERIRSFLRLDFLFRLTDHCLDGTTEWDSRATIDCLLDINDLLGRTDIKNELIKELEKDSSTLRTLKQNPGVDLERLEMILGNIQKYLESLRDQAYQPGQSLKQDELITSIRQRNAILGGSCNFDLPGYHQWLSRPLSFQKQSLLNWREDLEIIKQSTYLALNLLRNSNSPSNEIARNGFFQRPLEPNSNCQLIRIILPAGSNYFPETSAGKHRFSIRFMEQADTLNRPVQVDADIDFKLQCCGL